MTTIDPSGAIHSSDGRFTGHVGPEPTISLTSPSLFAPQAIPLSDPAALAAHRAYTREVGAARNAIQEQMDRLDAQLFVREMTAEWAAAEMTDLNLTRIDTATVSITDDEEDGERGVYVTVGRRTVLKAWGNSRILGGFYERFAVDPDDGDVWDEEWELDVARVLWSSPMACGRLPMRPTSSDGRCRIPGSGPTFRTSAGVPGSWRTSTMLMARCWTDCTTPMGTRCTATRPTRVGTPTSQSATTTSRARRPR